MCMCLCVSCVCVCVCVCAVCLWLLRTSVQTWTRGPPCNYLPLWETQRAEKAMCRQPSSVSVPGRSQRQRVCSVNACSLPCLTVAATVGRLPGRDIHMMETWYSPAVALDMPSTCSYWASYSYYSGLLHYEVKALQNLRLHHSE